MITYPNGADHVTDHALITCLSCTDDVPHEAIIKELSSHESRNQRAKIMDFICDESCNSLAIIKQLSRQESHDSAECCQADEQAGITQLSWQ